MKSRGTDSPYISTEAQIYNKAVDDFFTALDNKDKESLLEMFSLNARTAKPDLEQEIAKLFEVYPGPTDVCKRDGGKVSGSYSIEQGKKRPKFLMVS